MRISQKLLKQLEIGFAEVVAVVACYILLRQAWRQVPQWAKPNWIRRWEGEDLDKEGDGKDKALNSPFLIAKKLQELMKIASQQVDEVGVGELPFRQIFGCFLALVRLWAELRANFPTFREEQYHDYAANRADGIPGRQVDPEKDDLANLATLMDYSDWAYLEDYNDLRHKLNAHGFDLLRQDLATEPGRVGHFIAIDYKRKIAMIGIKGTSHISDIVTDLVAKSVPQQLEHSPFDGTKSSVEVRVHEGIWTAATTLGDDIQDIIQNLFLPGGFQILLCGHSLGAGTSCLLGLLLRSRIPALQEKMPNGEDRLRVVAFATPAVLNFDACVACAPFCTSVVNNSDIVPRASVSNLVIMNQLLVLVQSKVKGQYSDHYYKVAKNVKAFYRNMIDLMKSDDETIMTPQEWDAFFDDTHRTTTVVENLYVPGKVICLYERTNTENNDEEGAKEYGGVVSDGGMKMLRQIEFTGNMVADHSCSYYSETIRGFAKQHLWEEKVPSLKKEE